MDIQSRRLGKYELRERLASGGQGEVWKAFDLRLHRFVAIKQLNAYLQDDPDSTARFEREAQFVASLRHPNIVQIHDFQFVHTPDLNTSTAYMVMDYIEGPTLADYIRNTSRQGQFPSATDVVSIFTSVSLALDYAHQKGMLHRDIKPANIMLDRRNPNGKPMGEPILMDFGIAKLQGVSADTTRALGTPLYVSPEQALGQSGDQRSDLYSLGIVLYEVMTGITPFHGGSPLAILMQHCRETPTPPALINQNIPPSLSSVILKSIAKDPNARFSSASAMTIALAEALNVPIPPALWRMGTSTFSTGKSPASMSMPIVTNEPEASKHAQYSGRTATSLVPTAVPSASLFSGLASPLAFGQPADAEQIPTVISSRSSSAVCSPSSTNKSLFRSVIEYCNRTTVHIGSIVLLAILCIGVASYMLFPPKGPAHGEPAPSIVVGQIHFLNSQNTGGNLDEIQMFLQGQSIPDGNNYYAWLEVQSESVLPGHWHFTVQNGKLSPSSYTSQNLLTPMPYLFLITKENENDPVVPTLADSLYYAKVDSNHLTFNIMSCPSNNDSSKNVCMS